MKLSEIKVTQRLLRNPKQLVDLVAAILNDEPVNKVILFEDAEGSVAVCNGHHRIMAYWLAGRTELRSSEYTLINADISRPKFGGLQKLWECICSS